MIIIAFIFEFLNKWIHLKRKTLWLQITLLDSIKLRNSLKLIERSRSCTIKGTTPWQKWYMLPNWWMTIKSMIKPRGHLVIQVSLNSKRMITITFNWIVKSLPVWTILLLKMTWPTMAVEVERISSKTSTASLSFLMKLLILIFRSSVKLPLIRQNWSDS